MGFYYVSIFSLIFIAVKNGVGVIFD